MNTATILSVLTLAVSFAITVFRLIEWAREVNPALVRQIGRIVIWVATVASVPCLVLTIIYEQWTVAIVLAVILVTTPTLGNWRSIVFGSAHRIKLDDSGPAASAYDEGFAQPPPDPDLVRRAVVVLEDYIATTGQPALSFTGRPSSLAKADPAYPVPSTAPMTVDEAREVLGLNQSATAPEIEFAHRRLMMLVHPDRGGTNYLAVKINRAKDVLLGGASHT